MDPDIRRRLRAAHVSDIASRFDAAASELDPLDGYESFMFVVAPRNLVIRVAHSSRRTPDHIRGELDWLRHLGRHDVPVALPRPTSAGTLVELVPDGVDGDFIVTGFERARGRHPPTAEWDAAFARRYGELLGTMHALARGYAPTDPAWRRPEWNDASMLVPVADAIPQDQPEVRDHFDQVMLRLGDLPTDIAEYGLIHQDAHTGNLFVDAEGGITLFDFDDCAYGWFAYDLALVFYYAVVLLPDQEATALLEWFAPPFLEGYRTHHQLPRGQLSWTPLFMSYREVDIYAMLHRDGQQHSDHPWTRAFMAGRRERIAAGRPVVAFDWRALE